MRKKFSKKGFTLMEMLIVVAIIAILVAIAIPTFNNALEKSREATDAANLRSCYAEAQVEFMTEDTAYPASAEAAGFKEVSTKGATDATALGGAGVYWGVANGELQVSFVGDHVQFQIPAA